MEYRQLELTLQALEELEQRVLGQRARVAIWKDADGQLVIGPEIWDDCLMLIAEVRRLRQALDDARRKRNEDRSQYRSRSAEKRKARLS